MTAPGRIVILGAGPCGLGAAYRLHEIGYGDFAVFDREDRVGGLAASVQDRMGFTWDYGCHVLFSRSDYFNAVMDTVLTEDWVDRRRDAQVWLFGRFVPYPLQYNLHRLPPEAARECLLGLVRAATEAHGPPASFMDWIVDAFGDGLARHFMVPYNEKIWAAPLDSMSLGWIAERVPRPDLERALTNFLDARDDDAWGPNARFRYPRRGGIGSLWRAVAERVGAARVSLGRTAARIDPQRRQVHFADGGAEHYDTLVSTLPLDRLVEMAGIDALRPAAARLVSSTVHVVGLGIRGETPPQLRDRRWIYFPDPALPFYRATILSNFAAENAPDGHWSFLAEIAESRSRPLPDRDRLVDDVIAGAVREGFVPSTASVVSRWRTVAAPGYPTPTRDRDALLAALLPPLEALGIYSRGRFGAWKYEIANQDHAFLQGAELAARLVLGETERTLAAPLPDRPAKPAVAASG